MARVRAQRAPKSRVQFVEVPTAAVLKLELDDGRDVAGAFVRLTPRLRRSEREAFDVAAAERSLLKRGAAAAVAVPITIPDKVDGPIPSSDRSKGRVDARAEVDAWFGREPSEDAAVARDACLAILDEVGL